MGGSESKPTTSSTANGGNSLLASSSSRGSAALSLDPPIIVCGLDNLGNTCYCNSVIQMLYACEPLKQRCAQLYQTVYGPFLASLPTSGYRAPPADAIASVVGQPCDNVLCRFCEVFHLMSADPEKKRRLAITWLMDRIRSRATIFRGTAQQDAHEFAIFMIHALIDDEKALLDLGSKNAAACGSTEHQRGGATPPPPAVSPIEALFVGTAQTRTYCMLCDSVTSVTEPLVDLNVDLTLSEELSRKIQSEQELSFYAASNSQPGRDENREIGSAGLSAVVAAPPTFQQYQLDPLAQQQQQLSGGTGPLVVSSLRWWVERWSDSEYLTGQERFRCDACTTLADARRKQVIKRGPPLLLLHLKRFRFHERTGAASKVATCVPFTEDLLIAESSTEGVARYRLCAFVTHQGLSPYSGHYFTLARHGSSWYVCNDSQTGAIPFRDTQRFYGPSNEGSAYLFLFQRINDDDD